MNLHVHLRNRTPSVQGAMGPLIFVCTPSWNFTGPGTVKHNTASDEYAVWVRVLNLDKSTSMCIFGIVHLVYKVLRILPCLCIQAVELVWALELYSTVQRVTNMPFESECLTCPGELACGSSESYT